MNYRKKSPPLHRRVILPALLSCLLTLSCFADDVDVPEVLLPAKNYTVLDISDAAATADVVLISLDDDNAARFVYEPGTHKGDAVVVKRWQKGVTTTQSTTIYPDKDANILDISQQHIYYNFYAARLDVAGNVFGSLVYSWIDTGTLEVGNNSQRNAFQASGGFSEIALPIPFATSMPNTHVYSGIPQELLEYYDTSGEWVTASSPYGYAGSIYRLWGRTSPTASDFDWEDYHVVSSNASFIHQANPEHWYVFAPPIPNYEYTLDLRSEPNITVRSESFEITALNKNGWAIGREDTPGAVVMWNGQALSSPGSGWATGLNDQNQMVASGSGASPGEGYLWENGAATVLASKLPLALQGQVSSVQPFAISNQVKPSPASPVDKTIHVLATARDQGKGVSMLWKRDNEGKWAFGKIQFPKDLLLSQWNTINSSGIIPAIGKLNAGTSANHALLLLPVEMKVTDRDDPKKKWAEAQQWSFEKPIYTGKSAGDMVSWKIGGTDSWTNATFSWSAEGPENRTGPSGTGKNEWRIADGDEDTQHDWLDWKPGRYKIKCAISFGGGSSSTAEFEQEVGVRTEEYFVVGIIPSEDIATLGVDPRIIQQWACAPGESGVYMIYYALLYLMGGGVNNTNSAFFIPFDEANRVYVNHRLFNASRNLDPAPAIKPDEPVTKACGLDAIKHYRGFSACQFKFLAKDNKLNSSPQLLAGHYTDLVGLTPLFCQSENYAGVKGEAHGDSGKASGAVGDAEVTYLSKFRVGQDGQKGFTTLNGRNIPWVFFRFRFEAKEDGLIDTKFDSGASENPNGPDTKDFSKVPTWLVYRRYYDLQTNTWKVEQIRKLDESRRRFFSIGTQIPGASYTLP